MKFIPGVSLDDLQELMKAYRAIWHVKGYKDEPTIDQFTDWLISQGIGEPEMKGGD